MIFICVEPILSVSHTDFIFGPPNFGPPGISLSFRSPNFASAKSRDALAPSKTSRVSWFLPALASTRETLYPHESYRHLISRPPALDSMKGILKPHTENWPLKLAPNGPRLHGVSLTPNRNFWTFNFAPPVPRFYRVTHIAPKFVRFGKRVSVLL